MTLFLNCTVQVDRLVGKHVMSVVAGDFHSVVLTDTGDVYTWGYNANGQVGGCTATRQLGADSCVI